jgi:8-oxo-dGTP diphosphatase
METLQPLAVPAVDAVILAVAEGEVWAALAPGITDAASGGWALPGVLIRKSESVPDALARMVRDKLSGCYGGAFRPFGFSAEPNRDPRGRVVSLFHVGFLRCGERTSFEGLTGHRLCSIRQGSGRAEARVDGRPVRLAYDHAEILQSSLAWLRTQLPRGAVTRDLLGDLFTRTALREVYEAVYGTRIPQQAFDYHVRAKGLAERTPLMSEGGLGRPASLYRPPSLPPNHWEPTP